MSTTVARVTLPGMSDGSTEDLARRLDRIERFLIRQGFDPAEVERETAVAPPIVARPIVDEPPRVVPPPLPVAAAAVPTMDEVDDRGVPITTVAEPIALAEPSRPDKAAQFAAMRATVVAPPPMPGAMESERSRAFARPAEAEVRTRGFPGESRVESGGFEQLVGLKLAGWVGAIVFVIGAALGVKFAYDQGWLGGLPNSVRLGLLYAVGFVVVGLGEWVYRRAGALASVGVYGAGVAILFVVGYAGDAYFNLYGQRVAFALMAGASAVGAIVALRAQLASIAVLSLVGANLAPVLLGRSTAGESTLLVYLLALQVLALVLAHVGRGERWWTLRGVSLATTALWVIVRLADPATARSTPTIGFTLLYAAIFQLESALAAWRAASRPARLQGTFAAFSASVTTFLTLAILVWTEPWPRGQAGAALMGLAMLAIVAGGAAMNVARGRAWRELAVSWLGQGMTLVVVAIPVALDGPAVAIAFGALALLYATLGVYARRPGPSVAAAIVWGLAVLNLAATFDATPIATVMGTAISRGLLLGIGLAGVGHVLGVLLASGRLTDRRFTLDRPTEVGTPEEGVAPPPARVTFALAGVARVAMPILATVVAVVTCHAALDGIHATQATALLAWATLGVAMLARRTSAARLIANLAVGVAALAVLRWLLLDAVAGPSRSPIVNVVMGTGVVVAAMLVAIVWGTTGLRRGEGTAGAAAEGQAGMPVLRDDDVAVVAVEVERFVAIGFAVGAVAIGLAAEFDAAAKAYVANAAAPRWNPTQLTCLAHTALAIVVALAALPVSRWVAPRATTASGVARFVGGAVALIAAKFVVVDTLAFAFDDRVWLPTPLVNFQAGVAALATGACVFAARRGVGAAALAMAALVPLAAGSVEVARAVGPGRTLVALSIFWAAYGATMIAVGFTLRGGLGLRIGGLALLAVTIGKVVLVDLASAGTGWRILSFLAVGVLLLATSVLYGKFGATLMRRDDDDEAGRGFAPDLNETR